MPFLFLIIAGFVAGFYGSSVGSGGLVSLPALLLIGLPTPVAIATNRFAVVFGEGMSVLRYRRTQKLPWGLVVAVGIAASLGSYLGAHLVLRIPSSVLNVIVAVLLVALFIFLLAKPKLGAEEKILLHRHKILLGIGAFFLGIYGGFLGTGFGTFIMLLLAWGGLSFLQSAATARAVGFLMSLVATLSFASTNTIRYLEGAALALGFVIGCFFGVRMGVKHGNAYIRTLLIIVIIITAGQLLWKTFR
ncbi:MAG: sulfite exporter TauE/SafE family protein [Candidatus Peribacteraceae bacterium]|nr:sulfite exporter TauE/SafE family protein [Candidatus Peribacteraceae bacterium]MDD5742553.1 sulfite exporter TauE/SafE family protein [Candidatus Peribacteraceae bacterium]